MEEMMLHATAQTTFPMIPCDSLGQIEFGEVLEGTHWRRHTLQLVVIQEENFQRVPQDYSKLNGTHCKNRAREMRRSPKAHDAELNPCRLMEDHSTVEICPCLHKHQGSSATLSFTNTCFFWFASIKWQKGHTIYNLCREGNSIMHNTEKHLNLKLTLLTLFDLFLCLFEFHSISIFQKRNTTEINNKNTLKMKYQNENA